MGRRRKRQARKEGLFIFGKVIEMHVMRLRYFVGVCFRVINNR